jgi:biopolymer transport protein ExbB/TolQ
MLVFMLYTWNQKVFLTKTGLCLIQGPVKIIFLSYVIFTLRMVVPLQTFKYLQEIKEFVAAESKGSTQLNDALQKAVQAQSTLQKLEQEVREKLQEELERVSVLQSSNGALEKSLCEVHETVRFVNI